MRVEINEAQKEKYEQSGLWGEKTLLHYWRAAVAQHADKEYIVDDLGCRLTFAQVDRKANALAMFMKERGIKAGDVVSLQCTPRCEFIIIVIACLKLGAVIVPIRMRTGAAEWIQLMERVHSKLHFSVSEYHNKCFYDFIVRTSKEMDTPLHTVFIGKKRGSRRYSYFDDIVNLKEDNECTEEKANMETPEVDANDVAAIIFTSGTTTGSKGVLLTHNNIISSERIFNDTLHLCSDDIIFMPAPLSHATGFHHGIISTILSGGKLVMMENYEERRALSIMEEERCTYSMGATPFVYDYVKLMDEGCPKPSSLKYYICGGAPVPFELTRSAWLRHKLIVCECYGSTESVPHVIVPPELAVEMEGKWSGRVMDGIEMRIVDEKGNDVAPGEVGEELSRGPNVFVGYLDDPKTTAEVLDEDGWYHSGDLCYGDGKGHIKICGRKKDIIVRGGENLNINEIEEGMHGCPGIRKAGVIGMKDARLGERVCAFVVRDDSGIVPTVHSVASYLESKKVSKWLWPERIEFIAELPYTDSGKLKRHELEKELARRSGEEKEK